MQCIAAFLSYRKPIYSLFFIFLHSWRERFRAPFMVKDMKQGRLNPLPWSEKNVEK